MTKESTIRTFLTDEPRNTAAQGEDRSDLARVNAMSEADLERSIAADPDWHGVPQDWYRGAEAVMPRPKVLRPGCPRAWASFRERWSGFRSASRRMAPHR